MGSKIISCQKVTPWYFHSVHSADDISGFAYKETKTMLVRNTISELNFEQNILPVMFHVLTKNAQMR